MNSIFPQPRDDGSQPNPSPLIGLPNFTSGRPVNYGVQNNNGNNGLNQAAQQITQPSAPFVKPAFGQIAAAVGGGANSDGTMGVVYKAPESDKIATDIMRGPSDADKNRSNQLAIAGVRGQTGQASNAIKTAHEALLEKIQAGKATPEEMQQYKLDQIYAIGGNQQDLQSMRDDRAYGVQGMKEDQQNYNQDVKGQQQKSNITQRGKNSIDQINTRTAGQKDIEASKVNSPTQQIAATRDAMLKIQTTRPDLQKYLVKDPTTGVTSIDPNTPIAELSEIQNIINPRTTANPGARIGGPDSSKTPTSKTPTVSDPAGIR